MALNLSHFGAKLYATLAIFILSSWAITALSFAALDVLNDNATFLESCASISLLTFLVSRLIVVFKPLLPGRPQDATIAHLLSTAHYGSRQGAVVLLTLSCTWLYNLLYKGILLMFFTVFGGIMAAMVYNDSVVQTSGSFEGTEDNVYQGEEAAGQMDVPTTALAEINEFQEKAGFDPTQLMRWIPPRVLIYVVAAMWVNFSTLGLYLLGHAAKSLIKVLSSPSAAAVGNGTTIPANIPVSEKDQSMNTSETAVDAKDGSLASN